MLNSVIDVQVEEHTTFLDKVLSERTIAKAIRRFTASAAPDQFGWRPFQHLRSVLRLKESHRKKFIDHILKPIALGYNSGAFLEDYTRGGRFIPAAKSVEKGGIRPIVIGDIERRIVSSAFCKFYRNPLELHFTTSHPTVLQFCVGLEEGALKFCKTIQCLLGPQLEEPSPEDPNSWDPIVLITVDGKNAFNEISRQKLFEVLLSNSDRRCPEFSQGILPYVSQYYGQAGKLFLKQGVDCKAFWGSSGVSQGDPLAMALFAHTLFPSIVKVADQFPTCNFPSYADNIAIVGRLSSAAQATGRLIQVLKEDLHLEIQTRESQIFSASWCGGSADQLEVSQRYIKEHYPLLQDFAFRGEGIILGGIPIGTKAFQQDFMLRKVLGLNAELEQLAAFPNVMGLKQLIKFTHVPTLQYFLRGVPPDISRPYCKTFDQANLRCLGRIFQWPADDLGDPGNGVNGAVSDLQFAYFKRQLPYSEGGDGFTPQEGVAYTAYWSATAKFLQWASGISLFKDRILAPSSPFVPSSAGLGELPSSCSMIQAYLDTHQYLLEQGISEYGSFAELDDAAKYNWIPAPGLFRSGEAKRLFLPPQRVLTAQSLLQFPAFRTIRGHLSERQKSLLAHHSSHSTQLRLRGNPISDLLSENTPQRSIWQSVMESMNLGTFTQQPISLLSAADKFLHGLPINLPPYCDKCQTPLQHPGGTTHLATCLHRSALWTEAHERCCMELKTLIVDAGIQAGLVQQGLPRTRQNVSQHSPTDHHMGDLELSQLRSGAWQGLILDFSMSHVFNTDGIPQQVRQHLSAAASRKTRNHRLAYAQHVPPKAFLPVIVTTDGVFHDDVLRFLWFLAERMASKETTEMDDLSASQEVSGDPLFKRIRSRHFRRLKASFAYSAIIAGTVRYASHSFGSGVGLSSNGAGDGPGVLRPRRRMQRAPRSSAGRQDGSGLGW